MPAPSSSTVAPQPLPAASRAGMVRIEGGAFCMGSDDFYPEERPAHRVRVSNFLIDRHPVTNSQFEAFIAATGYVTVAERPLDPADYPRVPAEALIPGSLVFSPRIDVARWRGAADWWDFVPSASWRRPQGRASSIAKLHNHPVVHVAYEDAQSYAHWADKDLPTEAEWEFAARGGLENAPYCWGDEFMPAGRRMAHTWDGDFPLPAPGAENAGRTSAVASYPPNGYGLYDMAGNVWEWTCDWYHTVHATDPANPCCIPLDPRGGSIAQSYDPAQGHIRIPRKVLKGGSFLCAPNYCRRYRPAARQPQMIDSAASHIGFRCVVRLR